MFASFIQKYFYDIRRYKKFTNIVEPNAKTIQTIIETIRYIYFLEFELTKKEQFKK